MTQQWEGAASATCLKHAPCTAYRPQQWAPLALASSGADVVMGESYCWCSILWRQLHNSTRWADSQALWAAYALPSCITHVEMACMVLPAAHSMSHCMDSVSRGSVVTCTLLCFHY